jgi:hypothetical protein
VVALDLAPTACAAARDWLKESADVEAAQRVTVVEGNFFEKDFGEPFDLAWDCTFLCALQPTERVAWAQRYHSIMRPGATLATLVFPIAPGKTDGPPFHLDVPIVKALLEPVGFELVSTHEFPAGTHMPNRPMGNTVCIWRRGA